MGIVEGYLEELTGLLTRYEVPSELRRLVREDVGRRLRSVLAHWDDLRFRSTVLEVGREEGTFMEPRTAPLEVRQLVVVTVRNSLLEELHTDEPADPRFRQGPYVRGDGIPVFTAHAIRYFHSVYDQLMGEEVLEGDDVFEKIARRYYRAWVAMNVVSELGEQKEVGLEGGLDGFERPESLARFKAMEREIERKRKIHKGRLYGSADPVVRSGLDGKLYPGEAAILWRQKERPTGWVSDSFKMLTRNPEKLFMVLEWLLRVGATFLSPNYCISPHYYARRNPLLRPGHRAHELYDRIANKNGLAPTHQQILEAVRRSSL